MIHDPYDFPDDNAETKSISQKMIAYIFAFPESTYSTPEVRHLQPQTRLCYFSDEHKLSYFQRYSYINCLAECRAEIAYRFCSCVPYFYPNNGTYQVCEMKDMQCIRQHRSAYAGALPGLNKTIIEKVDSDADFMPCDCLPDCQLNQYPSEITSADLNLTYSITKLSLL